MIERTMKWFAKRYVLGKLNKLLAEYKVSVEKVTATLATWIVRLEKVLNLLKCLNARLDDGKIDEEEVKDSIADISNFVKEW